MPKTKAEVLRQLVADEPAPFEKLREYIELAADQLLRDMQDQAVAYAVPADDATQLVKRVAAIEGVPPLWTLRSWALRHVLPINDFIGILACRELAPHELGALRKRLRDALGYVVLALVLTEGDQT